MSDWDVTSAVADAQFKFDPPQDAKAITFMTLETASSSKR
jgi:hypothetical protein